MRPFRRDPPGNRELRATAQRRTSSTMRNGIDSSQLRGLTRKSLLPDPSLLIQLVGTPTLPDTLRTTRVRAVVCFTGMRSNQWTVRDSSPIEYLPRRVRLTAYGGDATDLPTAILQAFLDAVAAGDAVVPIHRIDRLDEIAEAHADMEAGRATGKLLVVL